MYPLLLGMMLKLLGSGFVRPDDFQHIAREASLKKKNNLFSFESLER